MKRLLALVALLTAGLLAWGAGAASGLGPCTITWVGDVDASWTTNSGGNTNWSGDVLPGAGDTACLPAAGSAYAVSLAGASATVHELSVAAQATLTVTNDLTVRGDATNAGTIVLDASSVDPQLKLTDGDNTTAETLTNTGTIRTDNGPRDNPNYYLNADLVSSGTITATGGRLLLNRNTPESRAYTATITGTVNVPGALTTGGLVVAQGATITTAGALRAEVGELRVSGATVFAGATVPVVASAALTFQSATAATGALRTIGNSVLAGTIPAGVTLTVTDTTRAPANIANAGTIILDASSSDPELKVTDGDNTTAETLTNTGTIRTDNGPRDNPNYYLNADLVSSGTITATGGRLLLNRNTPESRAYTATITGTVNVPGALTTGGLVVAQDATITTAGALRAEVGELRVTGATSFTGATVPLIASAGLSFQNATDTTGSLRTAGNSTLAGTIPAGVTLTVTDTTRAPANIANAGTIILDASSSDPELKVTDGDNTTAETLTNTGTIRTDNGPRDNPNFYLSGDVTSTGTITATGGRLYLSRSVPESRVYATALSGTVTVGAGAGLLAGGTPTSAATVSVGAGGTLSGQSGFIQTGGTTSIGVGAAYVSESAALVDIQGGTLTTAGAATVGPLRNAAKITLGGAAAKLGVPGSFTQTATGELGLKVGGDTAETGFDVIDVGGPLTLDGALAVRATNGFVPTQDQRFAVIRASGARTGTFATLTSERAGQFEYRGEPGPQGVDLRAQDVVAPDTTITAGPEDGGYVSAGPVTFSFTSNETPARFECSVDGADFDACSGPGATHTTAPLTDGRHTFAVWAIDQGGNPDRAFALRTFTVGALASTPTGGGPAPGGGPGGPVDLTAPALKVRGLKLGDGRRARLRASCDEACSVLVRLSAVKGRRRVALGEAAATLAAGKTAKLAVRAKRRRLRRLLRRGRAVRIVLTVDAFDESGNGARQVRRTLKLRPGRARS